MTPGRRKEIQANMFAAALLTPEDLFEPIGRTRLDRADRRLFNVSESAMAIRIDQLGLE